MAERENMVIVGQGLAGTCLAWQLWWRGARNFCVWDCERGGSSRVAAGLVNPVTGQNFEPAWQIARWLPEAVEFYQRLEREYGISIWHPKTILRVAKSEKEWGKIQAKKGKEEVTPWLVGEAEVESPWLGGMELRGGRLDTRAFLDFSREFFAQQGCYQRGEVARGEGEMIWCTGALGLDELGEHRSAKGEMMTVLAPDWKEARMIIGGGGWVVPLGEGKFRVGATYDWNRRDEQPTEEGAARLHEIARQFLKVDYQVLSHDAGVRPILRRSQPVIGPWQGAWYFNGLGSKGSTYAPGVARQLAAWLLDGTVCDPELDLREFFSKGHVC